MRPVVITTSASNQTVFSINPSEVRVTFRVAKTISKRLKPTDIQAYIDLTDPRQVNGTFPIKINAPRRGISDIDVWPTRAKVVFYGAAVLAVVDVGYYVVTRGLSGLDALAFLLVLGACGFAMWRVWRDQHTYS